MKERGIIFKAEMVRATLDGSKTQSRRIVKGEAEFIDCLTGDCPHEKQRECDAAIAAECPYGVAGDRLWVRETLKRVGKWMFYAADGTAVQVGNHDCKWEWQRAKLPSIHMPRWASRITLEITGVRVERVQDISEEDAWAEGCKRGLPTDNGGYFPAEELDDANDPRSSATGWDCARDWYGDLWDSINGKGAWDANPWVWVLKFKKL